MVQTHNILYTNQTSPKSLNFSALLHHHKSRWKLDVTSITTRKSHILPTKLAFRSNDFSDYPDTNAV
jgi:hypothetical protein